MQATNRYRGGLASYLDRREIVRSSEGYKLGLMSNQWWGESLGTMLNHGFIAERAGELPTHTNWDVLARANALDEFARLKRSLTASALAEAGQSATADAVLQVWRGKRTLQLERYERLLAEQRASGEASLSMLLVLVREMAALERA